LDNPALHKLSNFIKSFLPKYEHQKSMLVANYFDLMPVEFRFDANPTDRSRSLNISVGARIGFLFESQTKIKYSSMGLTRILR